MMQYGFDPVLFKGKTVVITGAGSGIGAAVARAFGACGARVIAHRGRSPGDSAANGVAHENLFADFTRTDQTEQFIETVLRTAPTVDVLVNNAGTMMGRIAAQALTNEEYERIVHLNQTAVVQITRGLLPALKSAGNASIINTVSISARTGGSPGSAIYSASKAFVSTYSKALARELAPEGIRVNAISPGTIDTGFHQRYSSREKLAATAAAVPLGRLGTPADCAPAYLFLAADIMSGYTTGQVLEINGGQLIA